MSLGGYTVTVSQLSVTGTFSADATNFGGGTFSGELDVREIGVFLESLVGTDDPDTLCVTLSSFGADCETCSLDGEDYCLILEADQVTGEEVKGLTMESIDQSNCHPDCKDIDSDCDTSAW